MMPLNKIQKTITQAQLKDEEKVLKELKKSFEKAKQECEKQISALNARKDMQNLQSIIYQKKYQDAILKQIDGVLDDLNKDQYKTLNDFFNGSYATGYIGLMYDLQQSTGCTVVMPVDPKKVVRAVMTDSQLSKKYYQNRLLPENLSKLKVRIRQELSRGIASGKTWVEVAYQIATGMNSPFDKAMHDAMRIARTEGHRINQEGFLDAGDEAKKKGADIVKQWDATLDSVTRPWHQEADGQIREWDDFFDVGGEKMKAPSVGGSARNVCNCRCQLLQRAKWALDEDELKTLQKRTKSFGLDKTKDFDEFKQKYLNLPPNPYDDIDITEGGKYTKLDCKDKNEYYDKIVHDFSTQKATVKEIKQLWDSNSGYIRASSYSDINEYLRGLKPKLDNPKCNLTIRILDRLTHNNTISTNCIVTRKVDFGYLQNVLGLDVSNLTKTSIRSDGMNRPRKTLVPKNFGSAQTVCDQINALIGTDKEKITDKAFTSVSMAEKVNYFTHYPVKFEIQMDSGIHGFITDNLDESEFITKRDTSIQILGAKVYNDNGDNCILIFGKMVQ